MKKIKVVVIFVILSLALSSHVLYAYHPGQDDPHGKDFMKKMDAKREEIFKDLNLTAEQKTMLEANKSKYREEMKTLFRAMREKEALLRDELQKQDLDVDKITRINDELKSIHANMLDQKLAGILEVRRILSPDQFKKFTERMEKRREQRHKKIDE